MTELTIVDNPDKHRLEADLGDDSMAIAEYKHVPGKIVFTHTEVPPAHERQGIGSALIRFGLQIARDRGLLVVPLCPFFGSYMKNHAETHDLLDPSHRSKLGLD